MNTDLPGSQDANDMQAMVYKYDQLHRLVQARSLRAYTTSFTHRSASAVTVNAYDANYTYDGNGNLLTLQRRNAAAAIQDNFTYGYYANSNKLRQTASAQGNNYEYDAIGNLTKDVAGGVTNIEWTPSGKVRKVTKTSGSPIEFRYDASGNRVEKKQGTTITRYIRDASGNVMAVYQADTILERPIYGSSRLGNMAYASKPGYRTVGHKQYELSNHLGNVLAVVSDRIRMRTDSTWTQVLSRSDYYPFGLEMPGRTESATYRYGFNGKEKDPSGQWSNQTHYDYGFRIYNPTIGKFLSVDPLASSYPMLTPYQFAGNNPTRFIDLDGLEVADPFPDAYYRNAPKIDMTNGPQGNLNADGHPRSARYFWKRMLEEAPHMLSDENKANIRAGRHVEIKVDETWIKYNPTTEKFKGDQLIHHHIDQGSVASAMPQTPHKKLSRLLHSRITGGRIKGGNNMLGIVNIYGLFKDFFGNDPHDLNMQYSSGNKLNTLYFDIESNLYFNITDVFQSPNGRVSLKYDTYESYSYDSEDDRYIGVGFKETRIRVQEKNGRFINDYKEIKN